MKTIPPQCPEPEVGPKYWRSLDQVAETPEFRAWAEKEFPAGASEMTDPVTRRNFVKIMSASFLLAGFGLTGCRRPVEKIVPFGKQPEYYIHGKPVCYATAQPTKSGAVPLLVKSHDGRPTKAEGNPGHPDSNGSTDIYAQASLLNLYDPDRSMRSWKREASGLSAVTAGAVSDALAAISAEASGNGGSGLALLLERNTSPSRARLLSELKKKFPSAGVYVYEPVDPYVHVAGATAAFGKPVAPYYKLAEAKTVAAFDADFLGAEENAYVNIRGFAKGRKVDKSSDVMNRLYVVEGALSVTGTNADHRLRFAPSRIVGALARLGSEVAKLTGTTDIFSGLSGAFPGSEKIGTGTAESWITTLAADLVANKGKSLVLVGYQQPVVAHVIASAINIALGNVGNTVVYLPAPAAEGSINDLVAKLNAGTVSSLVILGGNPAYNAPADLDFASAAKKAKNVVRLGYYEDETSAIATWHLNQAHFLESWGDARTSDGTLVPVQPLIEPLFNGLTELEVIARIAGLSAVRAYDIVRETFKEQLGGLSQFNVDEEWKKFLHDGYLAKSAANPVRVSLVPGLSLSYTAPAAPAAGKFEVVFARDYSLDDGRYNNNGWLQELPDPVTKIVWENVISVSPATAKALGLKVVEANKVSLSGPFKKGDPKLEKELSDKRLKSNESLVGNDEVTVKLDGREITGPVWVQPGLADNVIVVALGYGREVTGRVGRKSGFNAYKIRTSAAPYIASGATLTATGKMLNLATTQEHGSMEGRPIVREATLENWKKKADFATNMDLESHFPGVIDFKEVTTTGRAEKRPKGIYEHPYEKYGTNVNGGLGPRADRRQILKSEVHQWGMVIDLNSCVGCSACVVACQSENNVPIVGKDQVIKGREMHWLRIDRYYAGSVEDPQVASQPMMCLHCENAPCESVCPVNATVHDEEGLNVMAYNRCIGTRYCSNNCPYKARRFNFFDYNKRENDYAEVKTTSLGSPVWGGANGASLYKGVTGVDKNSSAEWEIIKLGKNPNVSVRMRGVMEKCTFCVQRIEEAKINQKVKAGASGDVQVPEGTFTTACAQACPAEAVEFGNLLDPNSRVAKLRANQRNYEVLGFLETRPRVTYLARIRNPNPLMPDAYELAFTMKEYQDAGKGNPLESHHGGYGHEGHDHKEDSHGSAGKKGAH